MNLYAHPPRPKQMMSLATIVTFSVWLSLHPRPSPPQGVGVVKYTPERSQTAAEWKESRRSDRTDAVRGRERSVGLEAAGTGEASDGTQTKGLPDESLLG